MKYTIAFEYVILVCIFISDASKMDSCSSFVAISKMVNSGTVYAYAGLIIQ